MRWNRLASQWLPGRRIEFLFLIEEERMEIDLPEVVAEVTAAFERYERALVTNDVKVVDELFHDDPRTIRYGAAEILYGFKEIAAFRAARPSAGLARTLSRTVITTYGRDFAVASTLYDRARPTKSTGGTAAADLGALPARLAGGGGACQHDRRRREAWLIILAPSLRAEGEAIRNLTLRTGLLRRCAPRDDEFALCGSPPATSRSSARSVSRSAETAD